MGKKIPMWQCLITILFTIIVLMYVLGILGMIFGDSFYCGYGEVHIALLVSCIFASVIAVANGYKWAYLEAGIIASINRSMQAMLISWSRSVWPLAPERCDVRPISTTSLAV